MDRTVKTTIAQCEAALRKNAAIVSLAARELGIERTTLYERIKRSDRLKRVIVEIEEQLLDVSEGVVVKAVHDGDKRMAKWVLTMKGRSRGWRLRAELTGKDGAALFDPAPFVEGMTDEQLAAYRAFQRAMGAGPGPSGGPPPED